MSEGVTLLAIYDRVAAVDAKVEALTAQTRERLDHGSRALADHEDRLRLVEQALPDRLSDRLGEVEAAAHRRRGAASLLTVTASLVSSSAGAAIITWLITSRH